MGDESAGLAPSGHHNVSETVSDFLRINAELKQTAVLSKALRKQKERAVERIIQYLDEHKIDRVNLASGGSIKPVDTKKITRPKWEDILETLDPAMLLRVKAAITQGTSVDVVKSVRLNVPRARAGPEQDL